MTDRKTLRPGEKWLLLWLVLLFLAYQNCSPFQAQEFRYLSGPGGKNGGIPGTSELELSEPKVLATKVLLATELEPVELRLSGTGYSDVRLVGAKTTRFEYHAQENSFRWLPGRGEGGRYQFEVHYTSSSGKKFTQPVDLTVDRVSDYDLWSGPPRGYHEEDVGYVFVHGKGSIDHCNNMATLADYWEGTERFLAPVTRYSNLSCYDGRKSVEESAVQVAQQILDADCGKFNRCIVVTHSMGGLMLEYMFTHADPVIVGSFNEEYYKDWQLFRRVRDKTLFVISIASAAGGSKVADIVENPDGYTLTQSVVGTFSQWIGTSNEATESLQPLYASNVLAPYLADPQVPFFMVAGYSEQVITNYTDFLKALRHSFTSSGEANSGYFDGSNDLAIIDYLAKFSSRSDGLVSMRSSCGIASANVNDGPGPAAPLKDHWEYCVRAPKKLNHFMWFAINMNHQNIHTPYPDCSGIEGPCQAVFPDRDRDTLVADDTYYGSDAVSIMRNRLGPRANMPVRLTAVFGDERSVAGQ